MSNFEDTDSKSNVNAQSEPGRSPGDWMHAGTKMGLPLVVTAVGAGIGGPAGATLAGLLGPIVAEFFGQIFSPPLEKRREAWLLSLYEGSGAWRRKSAA